MTPCAPLSNVHYGTQVFQKEFQVYQLYSTDYDDVLWMARKWEQPLYRSDGPAEDWVLLFNPHPHADYPEKYPREGI